MLKPTIIATAVAGTLDILFAMILTVAFGRQIPSMLRYVASGPFPAAADMGSSGALLGLLVHFALMAIMAAAYMWFASQRPELNAKPIQWGVIYGLVTYGHELDCRPPALRHAVAAKAPVDRHAAVRPHRPGRHPIALVAARYLKARSG